MRGRIRGGRYKYDSQVPRQSAYPITQEVPVKTRLSIASTIIAMAFALIGTAFAQPYPSKPIKLVVPYPPGGSTDILARLLAERMSANFGQNILVEKNGSNANLANRW